MKGGKIKSVLFAFHLSAEISKSEKILGNAKYFWRL